VKDNDALFPPDWRMAYAARRPAEGHNAGPETAASIAAQMKALQEQIAALQAKLDQLGK